METTLTSNMSRTELKLPQIVSNGSCQVEHANEFQRGQV